jgi:hypothetical protein
MLSINSSRLLDGKSILVLQRLRRLPVGVFAFADCIYRMVHTKSKHHWLDLWGRNRTSHHSSNETPPGICC